MFVVVANDFIVQLHTKQKNEIASLRLLRTTCTRNECAFEIALSMHKEMLSVLHVVGVWCADFNNNIFRKSTKSIEKLLEPKKWTENKNQLQLSRSNSKICEHSSVHAWMYLFDQFVVCNFIFAHEPLSSCICVFNSILCSFFSRFYSCSFVSLELNSLQITSIRKTIEWLFRYFRSCWFFLCISSYEKQNDLMERESKC